jgi:hypothetical protein
MKKRKIIIAAVSVVLCLLITVCVAILSSPEYALLKISKDVKKSGIEGLEPHLTEKARIVVHSIDAVSDSKLVDSILTAIGKTNAAGVLKEHINEVEWKLKDILKGKKQATAILEFNYKNLLIGTIEINMERDDGWKISGIELPKFEKVVL